MRQTRTQRKQQRQSKSRKARTRAANQRRKRQRGGELPVPNGSVVEMRLDPKDPTSPTVVVRKEVAEEQILPDVEY